MDRHFMFSCFDSEKGSVMLVAIMILMLLTLIGIAATNTTSIENFIAGNEKVYKQDFYITEGGTNQEVSHVGYAGVNGLYTWYEISDPETYNQILFPNTPIDYDPSGNDMSSSVVTAVISKTAPYTNGPLVNDPTTWPRQNLMNNTADNNYDYAYLVTYLYPDVPPKGMNATKFSFYKFRINGQRQVAIEMGGGKVGPKSPL